MRTVLCVTVVATIVAASSAADAGSADSQLAVARQIGDQAQSIVAIVPRSVTPEEPNAPPFRMQNSTVTGQIARCFKGNVLPPATISYVVTAEGRPTTLEKPHVAFLRRTGSRWTALDGPMFHDSAAMRTGLARITPGCRK